MKTAPHDLRFGILAAITVSGTSLRQGALNDAKAKGVPGEDDLRRWSSTVYVFGVSTAVSRVLADLGGLGGGHHARPVASPPFRSARFVSCTKLVPGLRVCDFPCAGRARFARRDDEASTTAG